MSEILTFTYLYVNMKGISFSQSTRRNGKQNLSNRCAHGIRCAHCWLLPRGVTFVHAGQPPHGKPYGGGTSTSGTYDGTWESDVFHPKPTFWHLVTDTGNWVFGHLIGLLISIVLVSWRQASSA